MQKIIEMMPESDFDFKPIPEVKSFFSQCSHITTWLRTHSRFVTAIEMENGADANAISYWVLTTLLHHSKQTNLR